MSILNQPSRLGIILNPYRYSFPNRILHPNQYNPPTPSPSFRPWRQPQKTSVFINLWLNSLHQVKSITIIHLQETKRHPLNDVIIKWQLNIRYKIRQSHPIYIRLRKVLAEILTSIAQNEVGDRSEIY